MSLPNYSENEVPPSTITRNNSNPRLNKAERGVLINLVVIKKGGFSLPRFKAKIYVLPIISKN